MTFVNSVARIVHDEVTRWGGTCNKNLGNAFLMVWRIGDEAALADYRGVGRRGSERSSGPNNSDGTDNHYHVPRKVIKRGSIDLRRIPGLDVLSDKALVGFLKVIVEIILLLLGQLLLLWVYIQTYMLTQIGYLFV